MYRELYSRESIILRKRVIKENRVCVYLTYLFNPRKQPGNTTECEILVFFWSRAAVFLINK